MGTCLEVEGWEACIVVLWSADGDTATLQASLCSAHLCYPCTFFAGSCVLHCNAQWLIVMQTKSYRCRGQGLLQQSGVYPVMLKEGRGF